MAETTEQQALRVAWRVQDASNLAGVIATWCDLMAIHEVRANPQHAVNVAFADKVADLLGRPDQYSALACLRQCRDAKESFSPSSPNTLVQALDLDGTAKDDAVHKALAATFTTSKTVPAVCTGYLPGRGAR